MRTLLICALCTTLIGCSSPPRGMVERCTSQACFSRTAATTPIKSKRTAFRPAPTKTAAKFKKKVAKFKKIATSAKPTAKPRNNDGPVEEKAKSGIMEPDVPPSAQLPPTPDRVLDKATTAIGRKTEHSRTSSAARAARSCFGKSKVHSRGQNGEPGICGIRRDEAGHEKNYIRPTLRDHLWSRQREKDVG